jgi:hypothetical protein
VPYPSDADPAGWLRPWPSDRASGRAHRVTPGSR